MQDLVPYGARQWTVAPRVLTETRAPETSPFRLPICNGPGVPAVLHFRLNVARPNAMMTSSPAGVNQYFALIRPVVNHRNPIDAVKATS